MTSDAEFDAGLAEYQAGLYEQAEEARDRSHLVAARPDAVAVATTFGDLRVGDYMTNEGPGGRWVKVIEIRGAFSYVRSRRQAFDVGGVSVLFEIPESVTVSGETHYWLDRPATEPVWIDDTVRRG